MADLPSPEDEALLYVLGQLNPAERREFEARLEKSESLREQVRELEAGAVALALSAPQRHPPAEVWKRIEAAVAGDADRKVIAPAFRETVRRHGGWWAAAACLIGWALYAAWVHRPQGPAGSTTVVSTEPPAHKIAADVPRQETPSVASRPPVATNLTDVYPTVSSLARTGEIASLRRQLADLETHLAQLSLIVTQQQALLSESSRFTLFRLVPQRDGGPQQAASQLPAPPEPEVQRALLLALARQMGWLQRPETEATVGNDSQGSTGNESVSKQTTIAGVDFVDLPAETPTTGEFPARTNFAAQAETPGQGTLTSAAVTGGFFNTNTMLVLNSPRSPLSAGPWTVWTTRSDGLSIGPTAFTVGNNPLVLTIPNGVSGSGTLQVHLSPATTIPGSSTETFLVPAVPVPPQ